MRISDWSSDVCSSDLEDFAYLPETLAMVVRSLGEQWGIGCELKVEDGNCATSALIGRELSFAVREIVANAVRHAGATKIGRASCRERVCRYVYISVGDVSLKKKQN